MKQRCPAALPIGTCIIYGWRLSTFSHSTIVKDSEFNVEGVAWIITDSDENSLDFYEGYPTYYEKIFVETDFGWALTYVMKLEHHNGFPSDYYTDIVANAYSEWNIPFRQYIDSVAPGINVLKWNRV